MTAICSVVLVSSNDAKLAELRELLSGIGAVFVTAGEVGLPDVVVDEDADLEEVALEKARAVSRATGLLTVAEESGLEVQVLGGRPGPRSTSYAHERATDAENNAALLRDLEEVPEEDRGARFRCVLALCSPWDESQIWVEGTCQGRIARGPRGSGGFGYEPLFVLDGAGGRSLADLTHEERRMVSPRVRAAQLMKERLGDVLSVLVQDAERVTLA